MAHDGQAKNSRHSLSGALELCQFLLDSIITISDPTLPNRKHSAQLCWTCAHADQATSRLHQTDDQMCCQLTSALPTAVHGNPIAACTVQLQPSAHSIARA